MIEATLIEHFREVWLSTKGQQALRKAIGEVSKKRDADRPSQIANLEQRLESLDTQITKGTKNLLMVDAEDIPELKAVLSEWKADRATIAKQLADQSQPTDNADEIDADAVIEELNNLEEYLQATDSDQSRVALRRVYKNVTLFWKHGEGRYRHIEHAEIETHHPFALTGNTQIQMKRTRRPLPCLSLRLVALRLVALSALPHSALSSPDTLFGFSAND
jgi:deoxyribodipyrimidine photolyase